MTFLSTSLCLIRAVFAMHNLHNLLVGGEIVPKWERKIGNNTRMRYTSGLFQAGFVYQVFRRRKTI